MTDELLFANAVAKTKENSLFSEERLMRLTECAALVDAVRILAEANYGGGTLVDDPADFEKILAAEERLLDAFVQSLKVEGSGFECFTLTADYHNIKSILKSVYGGGELGPMLEGGGRYDPQWLKERLLADNPDINPYIDPVVKTIRRAFESQKSPRLIDTLTDKAMFEDIASRLASKKIDSNIKSYFVSLADLTNIGSMLRSSAIDAPFSFFEASFAAGGLLSSKAFEAVYTEAKEKLNDLCKGTPYAGIAAKFAEGGLAAFDAAKDNFLLEIFRKNKSDMFSAAPVAGYYLAKKNEIRMLRIALVCIKNGVGKSEIAKRMRTMYA